MSPDASAYVVAGSARHALSELPVIVPAGTVVLDLADVPGPEAVRLDGQVLRVAYDATVRRATVAIDLTRHTSYHLLQVAPARRYYFGSEDAKLRIEGVVEMLRCLRDEGLAWRGGLYFSASNEVLRDARLDLAWLDNHVPTSVERSRQIAANPAVRTAYRRVRARHGVPDIGRTTKLLRRRPELLEPHPAGPIQAAGERWAPQVIVARERVRQYDSIPNRRATALLAHTLALIDNVVSAVPPKTDLGGLMTSRAELEEQLLNEPFRGLLRFVPHSALPPEPHGDELFDERYAKTYAIYTDLVEERLWDPTEAITPEHAYASYADQVYQAFAATLVADALGLTPGPSAFRGSGPHFSSDRYDMWVNSKPPGHVVSDWRDGTSRRSALRPDITIFEKATNQVALLDAKYRQDGDAATSESLTEAQLYLQAYGKHKVGIVFPPASAPASWPITWHSSGGFSLVELPLRPAPNLAAYVSGTLALALAQLFH